MAAGSLRKRITFRSEIEAADGYGGYALTWSDLTTVWGSFKPERGSEKVEAGRIAETLAGVMRVRSSTTTRQITTSHIAVMNGQSYNIKAVSNPDQRNRFLEITVERGGVAL